MGCRICHGNSRIAKNPVRIAVTGGTGFIGRHVLAELTKRDIEVIAIVKPSTTKSLLHPVHKVVTLDLHDVPQDAFAKVGHPDALIHLAWDGLPNYRSLHHIEHELPAQYRFLKNLVESGLSTLVATGTCLEYGMQSGPLSEDMETRPCVPYGFAKDTLRRQLEYLKQARSFALTWARLFYLYGEGQSETSLWAQLNRAVQRGDKVFNMSGGEQLRDYLPVTEAARQIVSHACAGGDTGVINICSGEPVSIRKLVEGWIKENGWSVTLNLGHYPYPDYEPMAFWGAHASSC
jgi:nucleoside-diphosphate-sugar epimerase